VESCTAALGSLTASDARLKAAEIYQDYRYDDYGFRVARMLGN